MGMNCYAIAAWGVRTTREKLFRKTREWVGGPRGDRSFEFDPKTGAPLWKMGLTKWDGILIIIDADGGHGIVSDDSVEFWARDHSRPSDRFIVSLAHGGTGRSDLHARGPAAPTEEAKRLFAEALTPYELWDPSEYGLWVVSHVSY